MKKFKYKYSYICVLLACNSSAFAGTTVLEDSDFPRGHTYVNGAGNTLHIKNTDTVHIESGVYNTGSLSIENNAVLIVDNHIHVKNNNKGDAILVVDGGKAYFNNGLTAVVEGSSNDYYAVASNIAGSELHVTGKSTIIAQENFGSGIYFGENTLNSFDEVEIKAGDHAIYNLGKAEFNQSVNIDVVSNKRAVGIVNKKGQLTFNDLVSINMTSTGDFSSYNYGLENYTKADFENGLVVNFADDGFNYNRTAILSRSSNSEVNINNIFAIYAPKTNTTYALYAVEQGSININEALVYITGDIMANGTNSSINMNTVNGSIIDGSTRIANGGAIDFNLNGTKWYFDKESSLTSLSGSNSDIYFPSNSNGYKTLTVDSLSANNHTFWMNVSLNDASTQETDKIIINQDGTGQHKLNINNTGGLGGLTVGDGIQVVEVNGTSSADNFSLNNQVKAGIYEYTLHQGTESNSAEQSWYLRTSAQQLNPDIGSYLGNQTAATGLFMHSLHDRLGESQFAERFKGDKDNQSSAWVRFVTVGSKNLAGGGAFKQDNSGHLVHLGGDITNWTTNNSRFHFGLMGAYGKNDTTTKSRTTNSKVNGSINGYGLGAYFTWYDNNSLPEGWYADIWTMYNWFDNKTEGASYNSQAWMNSIEAGYAFKFAQTTDWQWMIELHAQAAYTFYDADSHTDSNGMRVSDDDANGFTTRLGGRIYLRDESQQINAQPFLEANWLHNSAKNTLKFDGEKIADNTPSNRYEVKLGLQGTMTTNLHIYSHIAMQWGKDEYDKVEGQLGFRYTF